MEASHLVVSPTGCRLAAAPRAVDEQPRGGRDDWQHRWTAVPIVSRSRRVHWAAADPPDGISLGALHEWQFVRSQWLRHFELVHGVRVCRAGIGRSCTRREWKLRRRLAFRLLPGQRRDDVLTHRTDTVGADLQRVEKPFPHCIDMGCKASAWAVDLLCNSGVHHHEEQRTHARGGGPKP